MRFQKACHAIVRRCDASPQFVPEDYVDSCLAGDLRNKVGPAAGKRATADFDSLDKRCHTRSLDDPLDAKPDIEHVRQCGTQIM